VAALLFCSLAIDGIIVHRASQLTELNASEIATGKKPLSRFVSLSGGQFGNTFIETTATKKNSEVVEHKGALLVFLSESESSKEDAGEKAFAQIIVNFSNKKPLEELKKDVVKFNSGTQRITGILKPYISENISQKDRDLLVDEYSISKTPYLVIAGENPSDYMADTTAYAILASALPIILYGLVKFLLTSASIYKQYCVEFRTEIPDGEGIVPKAKGYKKKVELIQLSAYDAIQPLAPWAVLFKLKFIFISKAFAAPMVVAKTIYRSIVSSTFISTTRTLCTNGGLVNSYAVILLIFGAIQMSGLLGWFGVQNLYIIATVLSTILWALVGKLGLVRAAFLSATSLIGSGFFAYNYIPKKLSDGILIGNFETIGLDGYFLEIDLLSWPISPAYLVASYFIVCYSVWFSIGIFFNKHSELKIP
jgi:hypothetical protein